MPVKTGPRRNGYNAAYKRHKEESGRNARIRNAHLGRQLLGPVDAEPLRRVQETLTTVIRFGGSPTHTTRKKGPTQHGGLFGSRKHRGGFFHP